MAVSQETLALARKLNRRAAEELLSDVYPAVWRMAHGLTGGAKTGRKVVEEVFRTALRVMPTWGKGLSEHNWFYHHTIQAARQLSAHPPAVRDDVLVTIDPDPTPQYLAFISALRKLPFQQREAFILRHGEQFTERQLGIAMDSSTTAATLHLRAAAEALAGVSGEDLAALTSRLTSAYAKLSPSEKTVVPYVRAQVSRALWWRRVRRLIRRIIMLAILGGLAYLAWRYRAQLQSWYADWKDSGTPSATKPVK